MIWSTRHARASKHRLCTSSCLLKSLSSPLSNIPCRRDGNMVQDGPWKIDFHMHHIGRRFCPGWRWDILDTTCFFHSPVGAWCSYCNLVGFEIRFQNARPFSLNRPSPMWAQLPLGIEQRLHETRHQATVGFGLFIPGQCDKPKVCLPVSKTYLHIGKIVVPLFYYNMAYLNGEKSMPQRPTGP